MVTTSIKDDLRSFRRSWVHHTGMQLATLTVLAATYSVVAFVMALSLNLKKVVTSWGQELQLTVYLREEMDEASTAELKRQVATIGQVAELSYVPREQATANFKSQMASYAPDLLSDADFSNPFPASFRVKLRGGVQTDGDVGKLEALADRLSKLEGVEDVSYGQSWIRNYSSFVGTLTTSGGVVALILLTGSLLVVGNSIRSSISARREEIEILELVGATAAMIRRPYVSEGLVMGALAAAVALALNFALYVWQLEVMSKSFVMARLVTQFSFFDVVSMSGFVAIGAAMGALGAWLTVSRINDGWSARQRLES